MQVKTLATRLIRLSLGDEKELRDQALDPCRACTKALVPGLVLCFALFPGMASAQWVQLGPNIDGEAAGDSLGAAVALSSDGFRVAVGAPWSEGGGNRRGYVRVHEWDDAIRTWLQLGSAIIGEADWDFSGSSVALSSDGLRVAIGAPWNDGNGGDSGQVRIFEWNGTLGSWLQLGQDINGENGTNLFGFSVALSSDGSRVAVGAPENDGNGTNSGHVRVLEWEVGAQIWVQLGDDIDGESGGDKSGEAVALSWDGSHLAVGAPLNDGSGDEAGHVRMYSWGGSSWMQVGQDIDGEAADDRSGQFVSLSSDGSLLAVGAPYNDGSGADAGHARVYSWQGSSWMQVGQDIDGEAAYDWSGYSAALSSSGHCLAVGADRNDGNDTNSGHVRVYEWADGAQIWTQVGDDIDGDEGDFSGGFGSVALSSDGLQLAIGATGADPHGASSGRVRVHTNSVIFADGFETGDTGAWSSTTGASD